MRILRPLSRLRWRAVYGVWLVLLVTMALAALYLVLRSEAVQRARFEQSRVHQAEAATVSDRLIQRWMAGPAALQQEVHYLATLLDARVTALTVQGQVLADSQPGAPAQSELGLSTEVRAALTGSTATATRTGPDGREHFFSVAVPINRAGTPLGALHFAFPLQELETGLRQTRSLVFLVCLGVALLSIWLVLGYAEMEARALRRMTRVIERITEGDLDARILSLAPGELGVLARALNRMADKLQIQMKKRARAKSRLDTVLHVMTDGVLILSKTGEVKLINPAAARLLHTTEARALDRSFVQAVRDHRVAEVWTRCQESGEEETAAIEISPTQFVRVVVTPYFKRVGRGYLVMIQDLTQLRRLQTIRQDFISNISHELRTPLASLRALAETLRDSALDDPPAAHRFLDRMEVEVDALTQMVEELLELSRIESGQVPLRLNPILPSAAILPAVERLRPQVERGQQTLTVDVPADLPLVLIDAERIQQVVTNLLHNAIKFTPPGGAIRLTATSQGNLVQVVVEDTGIGIAPAELPRIFERFYKADRSRAVGGTGLGLAISKHVIQAHGGTIWAESVEGEGSRFYFTLPVAEPLPGPDAAATAPATSAPRA